MAPLSCEGVIFTTRSSFTNYWFYIPVINRVAQSREPQQGLKCSFWPKLGGNVHFPASIL